MEEQNIPVVEETKKSNNIAIVGFILSFFFILVPFVLCIVGIVKSKKVHSGKGLSIAGLIISLLRGLLLLLLVCKVISAIINGEFLGFNFGAEFNEAYCAEIVNQKDDICRLNDDGTYNCIDLQDFPTPSSMSSTLHDLDKDAFTDLEGYTHRNRVRHDVVSVTLNYSVLSDNDISFISDINYMQNEVINWHNNILEKI